MTTETAVAVIPTKAPPLPATTAELSDVQRGWLQMCHNRNVTVSTLEAGELEVQGLIKNIETVTDLSKVQEALKKAKSIASEKMEVRKYFTGALKTKLIDKLMEYEKRSEELIETATKHELKIRQVAAKKAQDDSSKARETEQYKAHIKNEYARVAALYGLKLQNRIGFYYRGALAEKKKNKVLLEEYMTMIFNELPLIEKDAAVKFNRAWVTNEEAKVIIAEIPVPDYVAVLKAAQVSIATMFEMYDNDIKNAEAAIAAQDLEATQKQAAVESELTENAAMNNLVASADSFVVGGAGTPTVKKKWVINEENTSEWALAVMTGFIGNLKECQEKLLIKSWAKLTLSQMATALSKVANDYNPVKQFPNLTMKEEIK